MVADMVDGFLAVLEKLGINPLYLVTLTSLIISLTYLKELKTWKTPESRWGRPIVIATWYATAILLVMTVLEFVRGFGGWRPGP